MAFFAFRSCMEKLNLILELVRKCGAEVQPCSFEETADLKSVALVRGVVCSYRTAELQRIATASLSKQEIRGSYKFRGRRKMDKSFPATEIDWFNACAGEF